MVYEGEVCCPVCGGILKPYDHVMRGIRMEAGTKEHMYIRRLKCRQCGRIHRELPGRLLPKPILILLATRMPEKPVPHGLVRLKPRSVTNQLSGLQHQKMRLPQSMSNITFQPPRHLFPEEAGLPQPQHG